MVSSVDTSVGTERKVVTELPGPKSRALHERRHAVVSAGLTQVYFIRVMFRVRDVTSSAKPRA